MDGDEIVLDLRLYLKNTVYERRIQRRNQIVRMQMRHNVKFPVDTGFSIIKVQCPHCGGSFDARKMKCCLENLEWKNKTGLLQK